MTQYYIDMGTQDARVSVDSVTVDGDPFVPNADNDREEQGIDLGYVSPSVLKKYLAATVENSGLRVLSWQDVTLMRAEALIQSGQIAAGVAEINKVRALAKKMDGTPVPPSQAATQQEALAAVLVERRLEFAAEVADRFITLRRQGVLHEEQPREYAFPIPSTER